MLGAVDRVWEEELANSIVSHTHLARGDHNNTPPVKPALYYI